MIRTASGVLVSGMLASGAATTAVAAEAGAGGDGRLVVEELTMGERDYIGHVTEPEGKDDGLPGGLIKVRTADGDTLFVYCLDALTELREGAAYREAGASEVPTLKGNPDAGKIDWILRHGYPSLTEAALGEQIGAKLSKNAAAGGTQAAIWRLTNHVKAVPMNPAGADLADYLVAHAVDVEEPTPSLTLAPGTVTGPAGSVLGPIGIGSAGDPVGASLDPAAVAAGVTLTDREGNVLSDGSGKLTRPAADGGSLFVKAPAGTPPGSATVSATASVPVRTGHKLVGEGSQALGLVSGDRVPVTAHAKASWTEATTPTSPTPDPSDSASTPPDPSASPSPTTPGATADPGSPGATAGPGPTGGTGPGPVDTAASASSAGAGASELASTGSPSVLGFVAVAAGGLTLIGALVVLVHAWRRRYRDLD
ncbi:thioester domain-containing protein [Streptomyces sp. NBC_01268]|uniref:thioester domain-containing protein n=1 Tax=Streptomyces sp. NBC_01268 TaxID=2903806 RepID=UPI002E36FCD2|nr:thioester domain-containing protein [Streptomyces sp. NBC_01268]